MSQRKLEILLFIAMVLTAGLFPLVVFILLCIARVELIAFYYVMLHMAFSVWALVSFFITGMSGKRSLETCFNQLLSLKPPSCPC